MATADELGSVIIENHATTKHDGAVAVWHSGEVWALAGERVDRVRHSMYSRAALELILARIGKREDEPDVLSFFSDDYTPFQPLHHHLGHAASAYYPSPFDEAAVLVVDGMGPYRNELFASTSIWKADGLGISIVDIVCGEYPCYRSLGHLYSAVSWYLGFGFYETSHTMSLAAYGSPSVYELAFERVLWESEGGFDVSREFVRFAAARFGELGLAADEQSVAAQRSFFSSLLGAPRLPDEPILQRHCDLAATAQRALERALGRLVAGAASATGSKNLCYAGGVALNCVANDRVLSGGPFERVFIQPAADDTGQALGRLLFRLHNDLGLEHRWRMHTAALGPSYSAEEIERELKERLARGEVFDLSRLTGEALVARVAGLLADGEVVAWFQGRSEYGPRALGQRSILADPTTMDSVRRISELFKRREWYRPFAPSVLVGFAPEYAGGASVDRYMTRAVTVSEQFRGVTPAVVHVDGRARVQVVEPTDGLYYRLIESFAELRGVPVVLNTSFNPPGEPIVETPANALDAFFASRLRFMALGQFLVERRRTD